MRKYTRVLYWLPRILCILAILFVSLFALDAFSPEQSIWQQITAFLIHLIPSFILLGILIIAWKRELIGGIIFTVIGLGVSPLLFTHNYKMNHSIWISLQVVLLISLPFVIVGLLFIASHYYHKKTSKNNTP